MAPPWKAGITASELRPFTENGSPPVTTLSGKSAIVLRCITIKMALFHCTLSKVVSDAHTQTLNPDISFHDQSDLRFRLFKAIYAE